MIQLFDNLILYDTDKSFYKILCASKKDNNDIKCCAIYIKPLDVSENNAITSENNDIASENNDITSENNDIASENNDIASENNDITFESKIFDLKSYEASSFKKHKCYLTMFNSEFLLCCGGDNNISCSRNNKMDFSIKDKFSINLLGTIDSVIINTYEDYAVISYINFIYI